MMKIEPIMWKKASSQCTLEICLVFTTQLMSPCNCCLWWHVNGMSKSVSSNFQSSQIPVMMFCHQIIVFLWFSASRLYHIEFNTTLFYFVVQAWLFSDEDLCNLGCATKCAIENKAISYWKCDGAIRDCGNGNKIRIGK